MLPVTYTFFSTLCFEISHQQNSFFAFTVIGVYLFLTFREIIKSNKDSH